MGNQSITETDAPRKRKFRDRADWAIHNIVQELIARYEGRVPVPAPEPVGANNCGKALRKRVRKAFERCEYCGASGYLTVDRIVPGSRGGKYSADNVTAACPRCNLHKGSGYFIGPVRSLSMMEAV